MELEQEMTPLVDKAATEEIGVIRMNTAKTHTQRIIPPVHPFLLNGIPIAFGL